MGGDLVKACYSPTSLNRTRNIESSLSLVVAGHSGGHQGWHVLRHRVHAVTGTLAEGVLISVLALKFAFLKESLTSACFSFREVQCLFLFFTKTNQNPGPGSCMTLAK